MSARLKLPAAASAEYSPSEWPATKATLSLSEKSLLGLQHANDGERDRHQGGLGVLGQGELILGPHPDQGRERLTERLVDLGEHGTRRRVSLGELRAHADGLTPLPGKNESNAHFEERIPAAKVGPKTLFALSLSSWPRPGDAAS